MVTKGRFLKGFKCYYRFQVDSRDDEVSLEVKVSLDFQNDLSRPQLEINFREVVSE
jgi:hypothetical protein